MRQKVCNIMSSIISKNDKQTWENYIANFKNFNINLKKNNNNFVNYKKKTFLTSKLKPFKREKKNKPEGVIDLHGYSLYTAKIILHNYIIKAYEKKIRNILIITGKGHNNKGALKKEVPLWLNDKILANLLINYETAPNKFGGEGALLVRIKNKNKSQLI
ncbi:Smr/MutS family protein [Alphaproteobacteria bacterium]|nr:Smr/MutS family protein [Alphaproteobacteria bacterium]